MPSKRIPLTKTHVFTLQEQLDRGVELKTAIPSTLGATQTSDGVWRVYSELWPGNGIEWWNTVSPWRIHWDQFLPKKLFSFAEDVFGNQLVIIQGREDVCILNHENSELHSLYVNPVVLFGNVLENGIDWIDFYRNGSLQIAKKVGVISDDSHLHWTKPLILGGSVSRDNVSIVLRDQHHVGHAKLWMQVSGLPPGTALVMRPYNS